MITLISTEETRLQQDVKHLTQMLTRCNDALKVTTAERNSARNDALEEAAQVCNDMHNFSGHSSKRPWPGDCAAAIRALKAKS